MDPRGPTWQQLVLKPALESDETGVFVFGIYCVPSAQSQIVVQLWEFRILDREELSST